MKTSLIIISLSVASMCMSFDQPNYTGVSVNQITAKQQTSFDFLRLHRQGKGIAMTWAMTFDDDVVDFTVQRTYEDPTDQYANWEDLTTVPCNSSRSYKHVDKEVFPGNIHYRIVATTTNGNTVTSEISGIRIRSRH